MKRMMIAVVLTIALAGCRTIGEKIARLDPGIGADQVVAMLGKPDGIREDGKFEIYTYRGRFRNRHSIHRTDYTVLFNDGRMVAFGPGAAKPDGSGELIIVPPHN